MKQIEKPGAVDEKKARAVNYLKKGDELLNFDQSRDAMQEYMKGIKILEELKRKENSMENAWYLAMAYERVGRIYLLNDRNFIAAARSLDACVALRETILNMEATDRAERELRFAYELAGTAYLQVEWDRGEEYLQKHNRLCRKISDRTQLLEDHMELAGSHDYLLDLYEDGPQKTWHIMQMKEIYQQLHNHLPENKKIAERLDYAENLYMEHGVKRELREYEKELPQLVKKGNYEEAGKLCEKIAKYKVTVAAKQDPSLIAIDAGIDFYHSAAENYKRAGKTEEAVRCCEEAIAMRSGLVKSTAAMGENSHIYDVANARLGSSYLLAAETEQEVSKKKEFARKAYDIFKRLAEKHPEEDYFRQFRDWMKTGYDL